MDIIGQRNLKTRVKSYIQNENIPRCIILKGPKLSGKTFLSEAVGKMVAGKNVFTIDKKIDSIRGAVDKSYKVKDLVVYIINDIDKASPAAKNSLLKVTEEPPAKAIFILNCTYINLLPKTLLNRACIEEIDHYTREEKEAYYKQLGVLDLKHMDSVLDICSNLGEINSFININIPDFLDYIKTLAFSLNKLSGVDCFRLRDKIALKKDDEGYDLKFVVDKLNLFITREITFNDFCCEKVFNIIYKNNECLHKLKNTSISNALLFDRWILNLRNIAISGE